MKNLTCSCGASTMRAQRRDSCAICEHNGFFVCDEDVAESLGMEHCEYYYDEDLRKKAEEMLGMDVKRTEVDDNGCCKVSDLATGNGCLCLACAECGEIVEVVPFVEYC